MELAIRMKSLRTLKGLTQKELANLLGVGQTTIANYERGIRVPDAEKLPKIASLFGVTVDYLLDIEGKSTNQNKSVTMIESDIIEDAYKTFLSLLIDGDKTEAESYINALYNRGIDITVLYFDILGKALTQVGNYWDKGTIDVWREHYISEIVMDIMRTLKVKERKKRFYSRSVLALTPGAEQHNIAIKMIADLLELDGFEVFYLGSNVPVKSIILATEEKKPDIIALSVTMSYHIESAKNTIEALRSHFGKLTPRIIIGGNAFKNCSDVCGLTGADDYAASYEELMNAIQ